MTNKLLQKILLTSFLLSSLLFISAFANATPKAKKAKEVKKVSIEQVDTVVAETIPTDTTPTDTVIADREVTFNLEKLSKLATIAAYSTAGANINGLVVLNVTISEEGKVASMHMLEYNEPVLIPIAMNAVKRYVAKYKLKPAIKDGKPVEQTGILLPIVFDMSMFKKSE
ncbi:MAG: energy transducer TonB [Ignavibacteria bacterium]|nr:energy transducer TonB [Ignavibacteria bacterium]